MASLINFPIISNLRDKIVEYLCKRFMSNYIHEDHPITQDKIKNNYEDSNLILELNDLVFDENALNCKMSNVYYLNGLFLEDEDFREENNFNLPIVFTDHATVEHIQIKFPIFKLLEENSHLEINKTNLHLRLNLLSQLISKQLRTNLQESFRNSLMNSSIQIAEDLISNTKNNNLTEDFELSDKIQGYEGYEKLADVIRTVLSRIEFTFTDLSIHLTDNSSTKSKVELRIKRVEINDEKKEMKSTTDETEDNIEIDETNEKINNKTPIKIFNIEGVEILVNDSLIFRSSSKHTIEYDFEKNSIEVIIGSILNLVLNPSQLDALISVLTNKADESNLAHLKTKKSEFKDRKITAEEMIKVKEHLNKQCNDKTTDRNIGSNKLSLNLSKQLWSTGLDDEEESIKFDEFSNNGTVNEPKNEKPKEMNPLDLQIPGISICLLNTTNNEHVIDELDNLKLDLFEISQHIKSIHNYTDCLHLVLLNNFIHFYQDQIQIKVSNLMFCETYKGITEQIIFNNGDGTTISENIYIDINLSQNEFNLTSKQDIQINFDLTLYERLHYYLNFKRLFSSTTTNSNLIDSTILKDELDRDKFSFNFDLKNLIGKLFFPVPNLTENLPRQISDLHDDCIEFNSTNIIIKIDSDELKVYSDFIEINLLENYVPFREDQQQTKKEKSIQLISSKIGELRSLIPLKNLIELTVIFKPDVNGNILNDGKSSQQNSTFKNKFNPLDSSQFLGDNLEDSVFVTNTYNLDSISYQPFKTKNRKIVSDENQNEAEKILPNDKMSSINYLNSAAKVSGTNIILNIPQALILFSDQNQLNMIYNRFANDLLLWVPFNGVDQDGERNNFNNEQSTTVNSQQQSNQNKLNRKVLESDGNLIDIDDNFAHFDANVFNYSKMAQKQQFNSGVCNNLMNESFMIRRDGLETSNNHFDVNFDRQQNQFSTNSFRACKSGNGMIESTESDNAMYHSLNYSTVNPIYDLVNESTLVITANEFVLHMEHKIKKDEVENASKLHQKTASSPTFDSKLNSIHEFFSNYQLIENQTIVGKKLLIGCVTKMEKGMML